jgi:probable HAF family extracellular repeat protein
MYAIEPLDAPVGFTHVHPSYISAVGEIVGTALTENNAMQHAFVWSAGVSTDLGTLGGAVSSARGVNDAGVIVGEAGTGGTDDEVHAAAWDGDGHVSDLGELGHASGAYSVNSHGLIVGYQGDQLGSNHAVLWDNSNMHRLDRFTTGFSNAVSINDADQILLTGVPIGAGDSPESFIWEAGRLTSVGPIEGSAIDASGDVIGYQLGPLLNLQGAALWRVGSLRSLSGPSGERLLPLGINASRQVVGWMGQTPNGERAFVWDNGETLDLNERIAPESGWQLSRATAINDSGQIVGDGAFQGQPEGFLLTPE